MFFFFLALGASIRSFSADLFLEDCSLCIEVLGDSEALEALAKGDGADFVLFAVFASGVLPEDLVGAKHSETISVKFVLAVKGFLC